MYSNNNETNARVRSYNLIKDSIKILQKFNQHACTDETKHPRYLTEALELIDFFAKTYAICISKDLVLFSKLDINKNFTPAEKVSLNTYLNRKIFDSVAKLLHVSQLKTLDRGVFILAQILGDIHFYSANNENKETYKDLDEKFRAMGENLLKRKKVRLSELNLGLSKSYLKTNNLYFPQTEQILVNLLPTYVNDHSNISLDSQQLYRDYAMSSDAIHSGLTATYLGEYLSNYKDIAGISVRVRMSLEILNTYYYQNEFDKEVNQWLGEFISIRDSFLSEYKKRIESDRN